MVPLSWDIFCWVQLVFREDNGNWTSKAMVTKTHTRHSSWYQKRLVTLQRCLCSAPIQEIKDLGHSTGYTAPTASIISSQLPWKHTKVTSQNLLKLRIWCPTGMRLKSTIKISLIGKSYVEQSSPMILMSLQFLRIANLYWGLWIIIRWNTTKC